MTLNEILNSHDIVGMLNKFLANGKKVTFDFVHGGGGGGTVQYDPQDANTGFLTRDSIVVFSYHEHGNQLVGLQVTWVSRQEIENVIISKAGGGLHLTFSAS